MQKQWESVRRAIASRRPLPRRTKQKLQALLAAGLVLGIGATHTLANWTHESSVGVTVTSGNFLVGGALQLAPNASDFVTSTTDDELHAKLIGSPAPVQAGDAVYVPLWLRIDPASSAAVTKASVTVEGVTGSGVNAAQLRWEVYESNRSTTYYCDGKNFRVGSSTSSYSGVRRATGDSLRAEDQSSSRPVTLSSRSAVPRLCFRIVAGDDLLPNEITDITIKLRTDPA